MPEQCFFFGQIPDKEIYYLIKNRFDVLGVIARDYVQKNSSYCNKPVTEECVLKTGVSL